MSQLRRALRTLLALVVGGALLSACTWTLYSTTEGRVYTDLGSNSVAIFVMKPSISQYLDSTVYFHYCNGKFACFSNDLSKQVGGDVIGLAAVQDCNPDQVLAPILQLNGTYDWEQCGYDGSQALYHRLFDGGFKAANANRCLDFHIMTLNPQAIWDHTQAWFAYPSWGYLNPPNWNCGAQT